MEPKFQTSFIPKKPVSYAQTPGIGIIRETNVLSIIATVIFIITVVSSAGLFFYRNLLINQIGEADKSIIEARAAFEPEKTQDIINIDTRVRSAKILLENHVVVSKVLSLMSDLTTKKMKFDTFDYYNKGGVPTVDISGEILTYNALAEQQSTFLKNENIINPVFSNFQLGDNGIITVKFTAGIKSDVISYKKMMESTQ